MSAKPRCAHLTARGRPCRNPAMPGTDPPACATHRGIRNDELRMTNEEGPAAVQPHLLGLEPAADPLHNDPLNTDHFYFPRPTAADQRVIEGTAEPPDLRPEIDLVRVVLRRLLAYLDETAGELSPEEVRRVSGLVFTGARTVALLVGKRPTRPPDMEAWLQDVLREMGEKYGQEL
jgi:hypothetical protein